MNAVAELPASVDAHPALERARQAAREAQLPYAGIVPPQEAWALVQAGLAQLVDVRTAEERKFVGQVPGSLHVAWATGTALTRNPRFVRELEARIGGKHTVALLLCRSGKRSAAAAEAAAAAGFANVFNVGEGFEGDLDAAQQRGHVNGWRRRALPWTQD
ncbi:rhodanese [Rubrivivax gelatinosus]|uniref:rhodanese-like domain-containing protein n=1 Tax=Rubrivivax gelatinosus TaxID=28068 RepID=UPI0019034C53|nr:rhodanese-like domain-containing protein [Rubrivivax gelatinosus]MBK1616425.1 rhodanese [Rubrivivax gelatinosus]